MRRCKKSSKIVFASVSEHCTSFGTKNSIWGVCMSFSRSNPHLFTILCPIVIRTLLILIISSTFLRTKNMTHFNTKSSLWTYLAHHFEEKLNPRFTLLNILIPNAARNCREKLNAIFIEVHFMERANRQHRSNKFCPKKNIIQTHCNPGKLTQSCEGISTRVAANSFPCILQEIFS